MFLYSGDPSSLVRGKGWIRRCSMISGSTDVQFFLSVRARRAMASREVLSSPMEAGNREIGHDSVVMYVVSNARHTLARQVVALRAVQVCLCQTDSVRYTSCCGGILDMTYLTNSKHISNRQILADRDEHLRRDRRKLVSRHPDAVLRGGKTEAKSHPSLTDVFGRSRNIGPTPMGEQGEVTDEFVKRITYVSHQRHGGGYRSKGLRITTCDRRPLFVPGNSAFLEGSATLGSGSDRMIGLRAPAECERF